MSSERIVIENLERMCSHISSPTFEPNVLLETKLASSFQNSISKAVIAGTKESFAVFIRYLRCIMALSEKDAKFIPCFFEKMDLQFSGALVNILWNKYELLQEDSEIFMKFMAHLMKVPTQKTIISSLDIHHALIANMQADPGVVAHCVEMINELSNSPQITQELTNMKTIHWICGNVEKMIQHYLNHPLCWKTVVDLLGLALNVIEGNPKAFKSHLHSLYDVFDQTSRTCPKASCKEIKELQHQMTVILHQPPAPRERVSRPPTISPEKARCHELSIENLKISAPRGEKYTYPTARHEPLQRYRFIEILDPNLNVCIEADSVKDISLDYVAEVACGMLNSNKGGFIHIGISDKDRVTAVHMDQNARDELRLSLSNIFMNHLSPLITPHMVLVEFIPVFQSNDKNQEFKLWVVKISLPANLNTLFYLKNSKKCFKREGNMNVSLSLKEVRETVISFIEQRQAALRDLSTAF